MKRFRLALDPRTNFYAWLNLLGMVALVITFISLLVAFRSLRP